MATIQAKKVPQKKVESDSLLALFCFYFPQYTLEQARKLPYKQIRLMIGVAQKELARQRYELVQIVAAPHTQKGRGVRALLQHFRSLADG